MALKIKVKYLTDVAPLQKIKIGDWIDLRASKDLFFREEESKLIPLGVAIKLPEGYEAHIVPRSSTFKNFGLIQTNGIGIIDESYCGENDQWHFPAYATEEITIRKNHRICQFRIVKKMPEIEIIKVDTLNSKSRGGFGSTGVF